MSHGYDAGVGASEDPSAPRSVAIDCQPKIIITTPIRSVFLTCIFLNLGDWVFDQVSLRLGRFYRVLPTFHKIEMFSWFLFQ